MTPMNHINYQHGIITLRVEHTDLGGNQQFSNWNEDQLNKRDTLPGTGDLAKYSVLVVQWALEENLHPSHYFIKPA